MKNTNEDVKLSKVEGTVAYVITSHKDEINNICISNLSLNDAKSKLIKLIDTNAKNCESKSNIIYTINKCKSKYDLLMYMYNMVLAGDKLAVI